MKSASLLMVGTIASGLMLTGGAFAQQQNQQNQQSMGQQELNFHEVRQYFQTIEQNISEWIQSGNLNRLRQWTMNNIADNAVLSGSRSIWGNDQHKIFMSATLTKQDLLALQRFALSSMPDLANRLDNYSLDIQVTNIRPVGDSAAVVSTQISESGTLTSSPQAFGTSRNQSAYSGQQFGMDSGSQTTGQRFSQDNQSGQQSNQDGQSGNSRLWQNRQAGPQFGQRNQQGNQGNQQSWRQSGLTLETSAVCTHLVERNQNGQLQIGLSTCTADTAL